jgi:hypothetical protein
MIYVVLRGGLGNQLFQLGAALRLARGMPEDIRLHLAPEPPGMRIRLGDLLPSALLPAICSSEEFAALAGSGEVRMLRDSESGPVADQSLLDIDYRSICATVILDGYFQSSRNARALRNHIDQAHPDWSRDVGTRAAGDPRVVCHFRLGDYLRPDVQQEIGILNPAYLDRALARCVPDGRESVTLFTDDEAVRTLYGRSARFRIEVGGNDIDVFRHMMRAETLIIPNSTFSLMAAFLSPVVQLLCRPHRWMRRSLSDDLAGDFPGTLVRLPSRFLPV